MQFRMELFFTAIMKTIACRVYKLTTLVWACKLIGNDISLHTVLSSACNLTDLRIMFACDFSERIIVDMNLPNLRSLCITTLEVVDGDLKSKCSWQMPRLQMLRVSSVCNRVEDDIAFFNAHGSQVRQLQFGYAAVDVDQILSLCPLL